MNSLASSAGPLLSHSLVASPHRLAKIRSTVVVATTDPKIRAALSGILSDGEVELECVGGASAAHELFARGDVAACLCGFDLENGTYKELVRSARRQIPEIPVVIVSTPSSANEYNEYLAAMNAGAFDFLCYPYQTREVERILRLAVAFSSRITR